MAATMNIYHAGDLFDFKHLAGNLLLSDATPGLEIFPASLVEPMRLRRPADLPERLETFAASPEKTKAFCAAWREELRAKHSYARRLQTLWRLREEDGR